MDEQLKARAPGFDSGFRRFWVLGLTEPYRPYMGQEEQNCLVFGVQFHVSHKAGCPSFPSSMYSCCFCHGAPDEQRARGKEEPRSEA